jgi:hypothetical protein
MKLLLIEARLFLVDWIKDLRTQGNHAGVLDAETLQEIGGNVEQERVVCAQSAYTARVEDEEGIALLEHALDHGIDKSEEAEIRLALRHIKRSRDLDGGLSVRLG